MGISTRSPAFLPLLSAVILLAGCSDAAEPAPEPSRIPSITSGPVDLTVEQAQAVLDEAASGDPQRAATAFALPDDQQITADMADEMREVLKEATIDPQSMVPLGQDLVVAQVVTALQAWKVYLVQSPDGWVISLTEGIGP